LPAKLSRLANRAHHRNLVAHGFLLRFVEERTEL
jgi:hypothetical protein